MTFGQRLSAIGGEAGDTLIEILVTVIVLGITVTALIGALTLGITATDSHRRLSDVELVARSYGEQVVNNAMHPAVTTLSSAASTGDTSIHVSSSAGFPSTPFTASVDGEVVTVSSAGGTTWSISTLTEDHPAGSNVTQYQACPSTADLSVPTTGAGAFSTSAKRVGTPAITAVEYFDNAGNPVSAANCGNYWSTTGQPCSSFATPEHLTECDIGLIRATITVSSTDAGTSTGAGATTRVLIRRGNA